MGLGHIRVNSPGDEGVLDIKRLRRNISMPSIPSPHCWCPLVRLRHESPNAHPYRTTPTNDNNNIRKLCLGAFRNGVYNLALWHPIHRHFGLHPTFIMVHPRESPSLCWAAQLMKGINMSLSDVVLATHDRSLWRSLVRGATCPATRAASKQTFIEQLPRSLGEHAYTERRKSTQINSIFYKLREQYTNVND